jgi:hypothetical protein
MFQALDAAAPPSHELYGFVQALVALLVISGLAVLCLRWLARQGLGRARGKSLLVEERIALDAHSALLVVRVENRRLLLATHRSAAARLLAELEGAPEAAANSAEPFGA